MESTDNLRNTNRIIPNFRFTNHITNNLRIYHRKIHYFNFPLRRRPDIRLLVSLSLSIIILAGITGCSKTGQEEKPRNIVLMIGDGMGLNHVYAAMLANGGELNLEGCEYTGFQKTYSANSDITDSGASGTALATGIKTKNKQIGVDAEGNSVKTILELARDRGLSTGLIATSTITHATPASFAAHNTDRGKYEEIAEDISLAEIDMIVGGGRDHFNKREDGINLLDGLVSKGYYVGDKLEDIPEDHTGPVAIFADGEALPPADEGRGDLLAEATSKTLERLSSNPTGFFIMVEGSQIDWAAHDQESDRLISEAIDFDKAVGEALEFAKTEGNTLVIITADHETGGFTVLKGGTHSSEIEGAFSTKGHTGVMVPVFASGPGAKEFTGIYENTEIFHKMKTLLNL